MFEEKFNRAGDEQDLQQAHERLREASALATPHERDNLLASADCLRFKRDPDVLKPILDIPLDKLPSTPVSWTHVARRKFRFIDARRLAAGKSLRVLEFDALPRQRYVALSYVWRGSHIADAQTVNTETTTIEGAVGADPISIDILVTVCKCVGTLGCELLWIDGVCIIQNDEGDKAWQIQNMFDVYKHCKECLILPGGLSRLVPLDEPTSWIHRAWTLQEAVAPTSSTVLFSWAQGDCVLQTVLPLNVVEIEPGIAAKADLYTLLMQSASFYWGARILKPPASMAQFSTAERITIRILADAHEESHAAALLGVIGRERARGALGSAIWRASLTRVASRPADAVFSIMGLLGITLDPLQFDSNDRSGATIALMQALLRKGEGAEWLAAAPNLVINPEVPTLPKFPLISPQGKALTETTHGPRPISEGMGDTWWSLVGVPLGSMQDDGTLTLHAHVISIRRDPASETATSHKVFEGVHNLRKGDPTGSGVWYTDPQGEGPPYAVKLGLKKRYSNPAKPMVREVRPWLVMLVDIDKRGDDRFNNMGYAEASQDLVSSDGWIEKKIVITTSAV